MWARKGYSRSAKLLLSEFVVAEGAQVLLEESKELCAWLHGRLDQLDAEDWRRLPAEAVAWPHTRWATASTCSIRGLRDALIALAENLIKPLVQELAHPGITDAPEAHALEALHKHLARTVGQVVKELLQGLETGVPLMGALEYILTLPKMGACPPKHLSITAPAQEYGSVSVPLPAKVAAALSTAKAKQEAATEARAVLTYSNL